MSGLVNVIISMALFMVHSAWAVCTSDIDMQGKKVLNVAVSDDTGKEVISEAATLAYLQKVMDKRSRGNMLSAASAENATWAEALAYCANLSSASAATDSAQAKTLHSDWRLPTLNEWLAACHAQGSEAKLDLEGKSGEWYKENKVHPKREWIPAGLCKQDDETTFWWINRHSTETQESDNSKNAELLYHGALPTDIRDAQTTDIDPLHHIYGPEWIETEKKIIASEDPEEKDTVEIKIKTIEIVRNVAYGLPEAWNPTSAVIKKTKGSDRLSVRCVR